ncbi:MAG: cohesin domain-containing protein [bacterium]|nr:cohesin domain-containing protein [bacterium]
MNHKELQFVTTACAAFLLLFSVVPVFAAEIFFGSAGKEVTVGEKFEVGVFLDTKGEFVNAVGAEVLFPANTLKFQGVLNGSSVITLWVKQPYAAPNGNIAFSGVMPGGFIGEKGYLFSLLFTAEKTGTIDISTVEEKVLLHDGTGSTAAIQKAPLVLSALDESPAPVFVPLYDSTPPEAFPLYISQEENMFSGKWFLSFDAQDKGSGMDYYEVMEKPQSDSIWSIFSPKNESWSRQSSPYLLQDQKLKSVISVKAVDRAGNSFISLLPPTNKTPWHEKVLTFGILISILVIVALYIFVKKAFVNGN